MVPTRKKKQQNKKLFSQLSERDTDLIIGQSNHDVQTQSRDSITYRGTSADNTSKTTLWKHPQVDMHTPEENF